MRNAGLADRFADTQRNTQKKPHITMSENQTERSGRRRRGGRRRSKDREERNEVRSTPQKPATLWQKIVAFFSPKKSKTSSAPSSEEARAPRQYPAYEPRQKSASSEGAPSSAPARAPRPTRKPEAVDVTTPKLYIGNLSFDASESDLSELFNGVGQVQNAEIVTHKETEKSKGFGFVTMTTVDEAKRAVDELHDKEFMGRKLVVSGAKTPSR